MNDVPLIDQLPERWRGTALLVLVLLPYVTRGYHALRSGGGLVGIWNAILFGTNQPAPAVAAKTRLTLPFVLLCAAGLALAPGCATKDTPGRILVTTVQTVDATMQGWWTYEAMGYAKPQEVAAVRDAYAKYQAAESAAEVAYRAAATSGDASAWQQAAAALRASQAQLLALINQLNPPKPKP